MTNSLSDYKIKRIIWYFSEDIDATKTSKLLKISRKTVNRYFNILRQSILLYSEGKGDFEQGEFEIDESYF